MPQQSALPLSEEWTDPDAYVDALLSFATSSALFRHLCGGVHLMDFMIREPDIYTTLLPESWRAFFDLHDVHDILQLLLWEDLEPLLAQSRSNTDQNGQGWRGAALPPADFLEYVHTIRRLSLRRDFTPLHTGTPSIPKKIAVGMNVKKYHEVAHFSRYVDELCATVAQRRGDEITHVVDFGSGQSYLGRTLACHPYNRHIVAIERKHQYIRGAKGYDAQAKLIEEKKEVRMYNAKENCPDCRKCRRRAAAEAAETPPEPDAEKTSSDGDSEVAMINVFRDISLDPSEIGFHPAAKAPPRPQKKQRKQRAIEPDEPKHEGVMDYIEHDIKDGYLEPIIQHVVQAPTAEGETSQNVAQPVDPRVMVISLHSCGNLLHHGVRSLVLNPSVKAIAMIGCCYNLVTERLGPATYKLPVLRSMHPRLTKDALAYDPHGFPMSKRMEDFEHDSGTGVKINITARSMSLQAPQNWTRQECEGFFTRHFYRSLLQRVFVDRGVVPKPTNTENLYGDESDSPLIIGSLPKKAFESWTSYVRAAVDKLSRNPNNGDRVKAGMANITDEELDRYAERYQARKKNLSVAWCLMSFSAALIEAIIVVDRWQFLREDESVKDCWVEPVFDFSQSPRNLAVIGIKH